jgi:hypothetical protein
MRGICKFPPVILGPRRDLIVLFEETEIIQPSNVLFMWKKLYPGEHVQTGDIIRYGPGLPLPTAFHKRVLDVVKTDQHYFVVAVKIEGESTDKGDRTIIKYMDIGYNITLEIWSGNIE